MAIFSGQVVDRFTQESISGVVIQSSLFLANTDVFGNFSIDITRDGGLVNISFSKEGYEDFETTIDLSRDFDIIIKLKPIFRLL